MLVLSTYWTGRPCGKDANGVPWIGHVNVLTVIEVARLRRP